MIKKVTARQLKNYILEVVDGEWMEMDEGLNYTWCCDCNLRHISEHRIVKNKKGKLVIQGRIWRDDFATDLRRAYEKKVGKL